MIHFEFLDAGFWAQPWDNGNMIKPKKLPRDLNERAYRIASLLTGEAESPPTPEPSALSIYLSKIGRNGGLKGGKARSSKLSRKRKSEIARKAARSRWDRKPSSDVK